MSEEDSTENKGDEFRRMLSETEGHYGHAAKAQAQKDRLDAINRHRMREDTAFADIQVMIKLKSRAVRFIKSHGPKAFDIMPEELQQALYWDPPEDYK